MKKGNSKTECLLFCTFRKTKVSKRTQAYVPAFEFQTRCPFRPALKAKIKGYLLATDDFLEAVSSVRFFKFPVLHHKSREHPCYNRYTILTENLVSIVHETKTKYDDSLVFTVFLRAVRSSSKAKRRKGLGLKKQIHNFELLQCDLRAFELLKKFFQGLNFYSAFCAHLNF